jgi:type I restriction enzyme S subunit
MKEAEIGDVFKVIRNGASIQQNKNAEGIPITRIETIADGSIDYNRLGYASILNDDFKEYYLQNGDILMSHINSVTHLGKVAIAENINSKIIHGMNLLCLKVNPELLDPKYAVFYFRTSIFKNRIKVITKKSVNQASFNITSFRKIKIPLPPIEEQKHIAAVLSKAETLIAERKQSIQLLDEYLKSTFLEMFGDPVKNEKGWEETNLKNVCLKIQDGTHFSPPITEEGIPYITAKHVRENVIDFWANPWFISRESHNEIFRRCNPQKGDVIYIKDGATTGYAAINKYDFEFSMLSSLALLKVRSEKMNSEFLCAWLNNSLVKQGILSRMAGGAIKRLTLSKINVLPILVPPLKLQTQFAQIVEKTEVLKAQYKSHLQELEEMYGALSQSAFRGNNS